MWLDVWPGVNTPSTRPAAALDDVAVADRHVGREIRVAAGIEADIAARVRARRPPGAVRPVGIGLGAGRVFEASVPAASGRDGYA